MSDRRTYRFTNCRVLIDEKRHRVWTKFFPNGVVLAAPNMDDESIERARGLGYEGSDEEVVWEMTRWHDLLHTVLAEAEGHPFSPTLHAVAHHYDLAAGVVEREERMVLFAQRLLAQGIGGILANVEGSA